MRTLAALLILALPLSAAEPIDPDVLAVREAAWRAWFAGDEQALEAMLPDEFLAFGWSGTEISNREKTRPRRAGSGKREGSWFRSRFPRPARSDSATRSSCTAATTSRSRSAARSRPCAGS